MKILAFCLLGLAICFGLFVYIVGKPLQLKKGNAIATLNPQLQDIFYLSSLSPSAHNTQDWIVKIYPNKSCLEISLDKTRVLQVSDKHLYEAYISLGAYLKTNLLAFKAYGYDTKVDFNADDKVLVSWVKGSDEKNTDIEKTLYKRHSDKRDFLDYKIPAAMLEKLHLKDNHAFFCSKGSDEYNIIKDASIKAVEAQIKDSEYNAELASWIRFSDKEAQEKRDGLNAEQLGLAWLKKAFFYTFMNREIATKPLFTSESLALVKKQASACSGFIYFVEKYTSAKSMIMLGMKLMDVWFNLTNNDISAQLISAATEVESVSKDLNNKLAIDGNIRLIMRVGKTSDYGQNALYRRKISDYVSVEE